MAGALEGIKILDLTSVGFGPYACQILGDYGAEVIKIESPEGDITRGIAPFRNKGKIDPLLPKTFPYLTTEN